MSRWICAWALVVVACGPDEPAGLVIEGVLAPTEACEASVDAPMMAEGTLDLAPDATLRPGGVRYAAILRVASWVRDPSAGYPVPAIPQGIEIDHLEVELRDASGDAIALTGVPNPYLVPAEGLAPYRYSREPGRAPALAVPIPDAVAETLASLGTSSVAMAITAEGVDDHRGTRVRSNTYVLPITLCTGCLFTCEHDASGHAIARTTCAPGQDHVTSVCP